MTQVKILQLQKRHRQLRSQAPADGGDPADSADPVQNKRRRKVKKEE
jgi:hypothetical protein